MGYKFNSPEHIEALNKQLADPHVRELERMRKAQLRKTMEENETIARAQTERIHKEIQAIIKPYIIS